MISILIKLITESAKAAAPHVARQAHHLAKPAARQVAPVLLPHLAVTGGVSATAVGGAARLGQLKGKAAHSAVTTRVPVKPHPASASTSAWVIHRAEGAAEDAALGEALTRGGKVVAKKVGEARREDGSATRPDAV